MLKSIKNKIEVKIRGLINAKREKFFLDKNNFSVIRDTRFIKLKNQDFDIVLRSQGSDWDVFKQIFQHEEYKALLKTISLNGIELEFILDLGANIGLTTAYIKKFHPDAEVICVEPDKNNFAQLSLNIAKLSKIKAINAGIWNKCTALTEDEPFRGGDDWSKTFKEGNGSQLGITEGITIQHILQQYAKTRIDLLKIDIEGAERFIFDESISNLNFLTVTKVIAIEIHDEYNIRDKIYTILRNYNFTLFESGELTIGVKK